MNLVGLKELAELLDVPYDTLKVWKNRDRLPEPFQVISGTPVWDWDESEDPSSVLPVCYSPDAMKCIPFEFEFEPIEMYSNVLSAYSCEAEEVVRRWWAE